MLSTLCLWTSERQSNGLVVSRLSTITRLPYSSFKKLGSRQLRYRVMTTVSPASRNLRVVCKPINPMPPVMRIIRRSSMIGSMSQSIAIFSSLVERSYANGKP
jgi:hypothetical protein